MIIAIDGPAGSGKSTVAKALAHRLDLQYLDTGAMYRSIAWLALRDEVPLDDLPALERLARESEFSFEHAEGNPVPTAVFVNGLDATAAIRTPEVDAAVSAVARVPGVRAAMVPRQRELAAGAAVIEGRDIGTVVFPDADLKVYLTASAEERARRRHLEQADAGHDVTAEGVRAGLERRDEADSTRDASPLAEAEDAWLLDTTGMSIDDVVEAIARKAEGKR